MAGAFLILENMLFRKKSVNRKKLNEKKEVGKMAENFGLKIGLEGEKEFKSALTEINNSFKVIGNELKHVKSQFDKNDNSVPISYSCPVYWVHFFSSYYFSYLLSYFEAEL